MLALDSRPPCEVVIDGASTGLRTPQLELKLAAGSHQVTLINSELAIRETFAVEVAAGATEKVIKDFSDRIPR